MWFYRMLLLGCGGLLGTLARYWLSGWIAQRYGETIPFGTLAVNLVGCFLIGASFYLTEEYLVVDPLWRTAWMLGFLGGLTTFSSYSLQVILLVRDGEFWPAALYVCASNVLGLGLAWLGYRGARAIIG
ncbi:MAG: fluoride efflux transporter CrcB [Acidobacteriota bacterium]